MKSPVVLCRFVLAPALLCGLVAPTPAQEVAQLHCAPPSHDRKLAMPGRDAPVLQEKKIPPGKSVEACTNLPSERVALVRCLSINAEPTDMDVVAGWQCEGEKPCGDGASFSAIALTRVKEGGADVIRACATLRNQSPKAKTLRAHFLMAPAK